MRIWVSDGVGVVANMFSFSLCAMWHALGHFTISGFWLPPGNPALEFGGSGSINHLSISMMCVCVCVLVRPMLYVL